MNIYTKLIFVLFMSSAFTTHAMLPEKRFSTSAYAILTMPARASSAPQDVPHALSSPQDDDIIYHSDKNIENRSITPLRIINKQKQTDAPRSRSYSFSPQDKKDFKEPFFLHYECAETSAETSVDETHSTATSRSGSEYSSYSWVSQHDSDHTFYE